MSAPTPAPGDDRPREGYYPDPSIPGYVRYWNGAAWVPGTSRPAPVDGEPLSPPPGSGRPSAAGAAPVTPSPFPAEETGPHFFDEDPAPASGPVPAARAQHGSRPEPAAAWGADPSRQSGFGGDQDRRVSWGAPAAGPDPRVPRAAEPSDDRAAAGQFGTAPRPDERSAQPAQPADGGRSFDPRLPTGPARQGGSAAPDGPVPDEGTLTFGSRPAPATAPAPPSGPQRPAAQAQAPQPAPQAPAAPAVPQRGTPPVPHQPGFQQRPAAAVPAPLTNGPGGGQPSWAQQVHQLAGGAGEDGTVTPWRPPVDDFFQAAARRQAAARPAGLGRRLAARLVDSLVLGAVTAAAAVPLGMRAADHVDEKIDAAKASGRTVTVWLLDGTTAGCLGAVLAVLVLFGVVYEVLPTAKWGRTAGKKLFGLQVRDIEGHEPPSFAAALRRWLVYAVPGVLGFGVVGVLWCLFDKPWQQCWHDKAAHTFVAA
ncbi:RDD family protein [Streptomyces sp. NPDC008150]|uniref:RDD family protein n=1 Tax=Streptomyces sp. NPDC008150 TaxID=3364816 RepID=UPI0036EEBF3E